MNRKDKNLKKCQRFGFHASKANILKFKDDINNDKKYFEIKSNSKYSVKNRRKKFKH